MSKFRGLSKVVLAVVLGFTFAGVSIADEDKGIGVPEPCPVCPVVDQCPWLKPINAKVTNLEGQKAKLEEQLANVDEELDAATIDRISGERECANIKQLSKAAEAKYSTTNNENGKVE